jgi:4-hydroxybenzoate polyprenyltransferase
MRRAVFVVGVALLGYAAVVAVVLAPLAGALYALTVGFAFLMYAEFFASRLLARNAFVYAATHQPIVIPMYAFAVAATSPTEALSARTMWFALTGLGASFAFEVARKLDPNAHQILGTYLHRHGRAATMIAIVASLALLAVSAHRIGVHPIVWPGIALVLATLVLLQAEPRRFKIVEAAVTLLGFVQMLAPTLARAWRSVG